MAFLNYHHLRYFRTIATEGSLTRAAQRLNLSQSALSTQLRSLEHQLGQDLFLRQNKCLSLTEAGRIALEYAESIFRSGEELMAVLNDAGAGKRRVVRVGAVATLSRNFQIALLKPLLGREDVELVLRSGNLRDLLGQLKAHALDTVLSNFAARRDHENQWHSHLLDEQPVSLVGPPRRKNALRFRFPDDLRTTPVALPSLDSNIRSAFDLLMEQHGIRLIIAAEIDDMALLRLMAKEGRILTLVPPVVVRGELEAGILMEHYRIPEIHESFYAITQTRRFPNPILAELFKQKRGLQNG